MISKTFLFITATLTVTAQQYPLRHSTSAQSLIQQDFHSSQTPRGQSYTEPIVHRPALFSRPFPLHLAPVHENVVEEKTPNYFAPTTETVQKLPTVHSVIPNIRYAYHKTAPVRYAAPYVVSVANQVTPIQHQNYNNYPVIHQEHNVHPEYELKYRFEDHQTDGLKYQQEKNGGDYGTGYYGRHDSISSVRTVLYDANNHSGFSAIVQHSQPSIHAQPRHQDSYSYL